MRSPGSLPRTLLCLFAAAATGCTLYDPSLLLDAPQRGDAGQAGALNPGGASGSAGAGATASGGATSMAGRGGEKATGGQAGVGNGGSGAGAAAGAAGMGGAGAGGGGASGGDPTGGAAAGSGGSAGGSPGGLGGADLGGGAGAGGGAATGGAGGDTGGGGSGAFCFVAADCDDGNACTVDSCNTGSCANTPMPSGSPCDPMASTRVCMNNVCVSPSAGTCGNGVTDPGEQCDQAAGNGPGTGCSAYCQFEPVGGELVITEIQYHPTHGLNSGGIEYGEWFEVYNTSTLEPIDLRGLRIASLDNASGTSTPKTHIIADGSPSPVWVQPGGYYILARSADPLTNGGLPTPLYAYGTGTLSFGDTKSHSVSIELATLTPTPLDSVTYTGSPAYAGHSFSLDPSMLTKAASADPANFCSTSLSTYGDGDYGTPGALNDVCVH